MWTPPRACVSHLRFALARRRLDAETRQEVDAHLALLAERYVRQGLPADEAYSAARRQFGNPAVMRQQLQDMNGIGWLDRLARDVRFAARQVRRAPGFAAVVAATLGIGIGGTTAVFSVVQAVLMAPLPYDEPGQLVRLFQQEPGRPDTRDVLAGTHFTFLREHASSFEDVAALAHYSETGLDLVSGGRAERLRVLRVSSGYFSTLRSLPALGRAFDLDDETGTKRVVLSDGIWRTRFAANPSVVGTIVRLSDEPYEVAGIAPPGFADPVAPDVAAWVPYALARDRYEENNSLTAIGRLRHGISLERAQAELATLTRPMRERWPQARKSAIVAVPLQEELVAVARGPLHLLLAAVIVVLSIACVNVAGLVLVRATGRVHEFAVRAALGSSRSGVARQLLVESLLLAGAGGVLGLAVGAVAIRVLQHLGRGALPRIDAVGLDGLVLAVALVTTVATAIAFSVAPALRLSRVAPIEALRQHSRSATEGRGLAGLRAGLVAVQVALALTLLTGAAVLAGSLYRLQQVDLGVRAERALTFEVHLPTASYDAPRRARFHEELARHLEAIPGVSAAGGVSRLPATGSYHPWNSHIRTGPLAGTPVDRARFAMQQRVISGAFFEAAGIPLLAGRAFDDRDDTGSPGRAVVSANFASQAFPHVPYDQVPGQRIAVAGRELEIVGVVGDVSLDVYGTPTMVVYHAHRQFANNRNWALVQVVAAGDAPEALIDAVRQVVARLDPELVVHRPAAMSDVVGRGASRERFAAVLLGAFALVAVVLAIVGLHGVLAFAVRRRTKEIGIRMAIGASAAQVRAMVFRQAAAVVGSGLVAGVFFTWASARWLATLAFGISPADPRLLAATVVLLAVVAGIAAGVPANRAARVPPKVALDQGE